jgi:ACR3 family arsenite efflux pump ArsB
MTKNIINKWSNIDWFLAGVSEFSLFGFFYVLQIVFAAPGNHLTGSLTLWVLINLTIFACPIIRKHYL